MIGNTKNEFINIIEKCNYKEIENYYENNIV